MTETICACDWKLNGALHGKQGLQMRVLGDGEMEFVEPMVNTTIVFDVAPRDGRTLVIINLACVQDAT